MAPRFAFSPCYVHSELGILISFVFFLMSLHSQFTMFAIYALLRTSYSRSATSIRKTICSHSFAYLFSSCTLCPRGHTKPSASTALCDFSSKYRSHLNSRRTDALYEGALCEEVEDDQWYDDHECTCCQDTV